MKRKSRQFTAYQQTLFNKYEIDESYLQTGRQRRACLELLEKVDKNQISDEKQLIGKITAAFQGSQLHKKVSSCVTVAALLAALQSTPAMAQAASGFQPSVGVANTQVIPEYNGLVLDNDSNLDAGRPAAPQEVKNTSLHLLSGKPMKNTYEPLGENGVLVDGDSDVAYYPKQEIKTLTVIDTSVGGWEAIRDAVEEGETLLLDGDGEPLGAILSKLQDMKEIDCLNIVSHGESGKLDFETA